MSGTGGLLDIDGDPSDRSRSASPRTVMSVTVCGPRGWAWSPPAPSELPRVTRGVRGAAATPNEGGGSRRARSRRPVVASWQGSG